MALALLGALALLTNGTTTTIEWLDTNTAKVSVTIDIIESSDGYVKAPAELEKAAKRACAGKGDPKRISDYEAGSGEGGDSENSPMRISLTSTYECV
ncbi:hypothetical protein ACI5KX_06805 [Erythrobacter sp. GH1-10]|uniref:hypothetical protein n=1 Tax=Erythrobacter sp. GH1-10 TaxID=3349334 RepID=UPI0038781E6C